MKEEGNGAYSRTVIIYIIFLMMIISLIPFSVNSRGDILQEYIVEDSFGNLHKVFLDNGSGRYRIMYTNDIGGDYPEDWNAPKMKMSRDNEIRIYELEIYLSPDIMRLEWVENVQGDAIVYYAFTDDYFQSWRGPYIGEEFLSLKFAEFDPINGEPPLPDYLKVRDSGEPYEYYIVQHSLLSVQTVHDDIRTLGGVFNGYIPDKAYIIWMNDSIKQQVEILSYIRWIGYYQPAYKIPSGLLSEDGIIELMVSVFKEPNGQTNLEKVINTIESMNGEILYNGSSNYNIVTRINAEKIDDIANIPEVSWVQEKGKFWPRKLISLHHINIIDDGPRSFNLSNIHNFTSVGWDDELELDLNRTWKPVWKVDGGIGKIIGDGYTVTFKATNPGKGKIVCTDEFTGKISSIVIEVEGEVEATHNIWIQVWLFLVIVSIIVVAMFKLRKKVIQ